MITTFAQELERNIYEPWRFQYVSYEAIQRDIQKRLDQGWSINDEADFERTIRLEAEKVDQFITRKQRDIDSRVAYCERSLVQQRQQQQQPLSPSSSSSQQHKQMYDAMADSLTEVLMDLNDLSKYTRLNFLALTNLIKYHDQSVQKNNYTTKQELLVEISRSSSKPLDRQRFDTTLVKISTLLDICRLYGESRRNSSASALLQQHTTSEKATAKYWVHPDNVTELKAILLFHLPVLVNDPNKPVEPSDSAVSSVYFDNGDFDLYSGQLERDEGAEAIRFRWFGPVSSSQDVLVERRTHHISPLLMDDDGYGTKLDGTTPASWVRDRFSLPANTIDDFVAQRYTIQQHNGKKQQQPVNKYIFEGVQQSIQHKHLKSIMRIFYNRTTFQVPDEENLCVSLDTDLTFVREDDPRKPTWRRPDMNIDYPFKSLPENQIYHFPYAVLETQLQAGEPPEWLSRLLDSRLVYEVPRFSKYLHGAAYFWKPKLPLLPWWLSELDIDIRNAKQRGASDFTGLSRSKSLKPLIDGRYRMGYLESQLENRATIKRQPSKMSQHQHQQRAPVGGMVTGTIPPPQLQQKQDDSHVVNVNPFDDPIWNNSSTNDHQPFALDFDHDSQGSRSFNNTMGTNGVRNRNSNNYYSGLENLSSPRNGFVDSSSTDHLMEHHQRGSTPRSVSMMDTGTERNTYYTNDNKTVVVVPGSGAQHRDSAYIHNDGGVVGTGDAGINMNDDYKEDGDKKSKKKKKKDKQTTEQIEPKIFFANERTFINWLQFAALILTAALMLLNFGDNVSKIAGATFFGISMVLALYAFGRYRYRAWQITNRPRIRYDDIYGPFGLCILVVGALIVNFVLRIQQPPTTSTYLGINNQTQQAP
ncbi:VTC domain-containing protein [Phascolomyces articulosus]|uniref:VTC domain-containing protein n=1 Tax=Phascolomyces articulosus TaxID=60185 RepID=A0AAD5K7S9_9FUNG|nr:VTC domain-containing protein [Phascolomyces articulosus]